MFGRPSFGMFSTWEVFFVILLPKLSSFRGLFYVCANWLDRLLGDTFSITTDLLSCRSSPLKNLLTVWVGFTQSSRSVRVGVKTMVFLSKGVRGCLAGLSFSLLIRLFECGSLSRLSIFIVDWRSSKFLWKCSIDYLLCLRSRGCTLVVYGKLDYGSTTFPSCSRVCISSNRFAKLFIFADNNLVKLTVFLYRLINN